MEKYSAKLVYDKTNPTVWVVNVYKKGFLLDKKVLTKWFISEVSAKEYLIQLKYKLNLK